MFNQGDLGKFQATVSKEMHPAKAVRCLARPDLMVLQLQVQAGVHTTSNMTAGEKKYTTAKNLVALLRNYVFEPDQQTNAAAAAAAAAAASPSARLSASLSVLFEFGTSIRSPNASRSMELTQHSPSLSNTLLLLMKTLEW